MQRFRRMRSLQKFAAVHSSVCNHFNQDRSLSSRHIFMLKHAVALTEWRQLLFSIGSDVWRPTETGSNSSDSILVIDAGAALICFVAGTHVSTSNGSAAVEVNKICDLITTFDGRTVPVKWIGHQTVTTRFGPAERLMPVRVRAGALGDGLPLRDLTLTAAHALLIDGFLFNADPLVNDISIDWVPLAEFEDGYTVYHIETEAHDITLSEGAAAETFIDYIGRRAFDNYAEYTSLYGEDRTIVECAAPRITSARHFRTPCVPAKR